MPRKIKVGDFVSRCESKKRLNDDSSYKDVGIVTQLCSNETQVEVKWNSNNTVVVTETKKELKIISATISGQERIKILRAKKSNGIDVVRKPLRQKKQQAQEVPIIVPVINVTGVAKIRKSIAVANLVGVSAVIPVTIAATPQDAINRDAKAFEVVACNFIL